MTELSQSAWSARHQLWLSFVRRVARSLAEAERIETRPPEQLLRPPPALTAGATSTVLLCSPHPDDEALVGALPLRLRNESGAEVVNCAVTLGSDTTQKARRLAELESSCRVLGFRLAVLNPPLGLDSVRAETRQEQPKEWADKVQALVQVLDKERPEVMVFPHAEDVHPTHVGTHKLLLDALVLHSAVNGSRTTTLVETEYWHELSAPNLMVGVSPELEAILVMAAAEHVGEVRRNAYHLRHPARMIDNVRRGSELLGKMGGGSAALLFAELYRVSFFRAGKAIAPRRGAWIVGPDEPLKTEQLRTHFLPR